MTNELYKAVRKTLKSKPFFVKEKEGFAITDKEDWYTSLYLYKPEHLELFKQTNTVSGITDTVTKQLYFDFDNKDNLEAARADTVTLISRLEAQGITNDNYRICWSGSKGYSVEVPLETAITPQEFKALVGNLAGDLRSFDTVVSDSNRIIRVTNSRHMGSNLFKIPLSKEELTNKPLEDIKNMAKSPRPVSKEKSSIKLSNELTQVKEKANIKKELLKPLHPSLSVLDIRNIDWSTKPREWPDYKWALQQGYFKAGDRHQAMMVLAATFKSLRYDKETTYYACKSALKKQALLTNSEEFSKDELWNNIIEDSIFTTKWNGGAYSVANDLFLKSYCEEHNFNFNGSLIETETLSIGKVHEAFTAYANDLDKLTIKFGIPDLDKQLRLTVGMSVGLIGAPGSGKTSLALSALNFMSKAGETCVFFSFDMYHSIVYTKLVSKHLNLTIDEILLKLTGKKTIYKEDVDYKTLLKEGRKVTEETEFMATFDFSDRLEKNFENRIKTKLTEEYANVHFCFTSGMDMDAMEDTLKKVETSTGKKVRFMVTDYNELVSTGISDPTQSSNFVAQRMREIALKHSVCVLQLFQPTKMTGTPADEITSYNSAKGGGGLAQSVSVMLGMSRPGYGPDAFDDVYARVNCLKNRSGTLFSVDLGFHGLTGNFKTLSATEKADLAALRKAIVEEKKKDEL